MSEKVVQFYRFLSFFLLGTCSFVVFLFLVYVYFIQNYSDFSNGLKHGLSIGTIIIIWETYRFIRKEYLIFDRIEICYDLVSSEKIKRNLFLKNLKLKNTILVLVVILIEVLFLTNIFPVSMYLKGIKLALLILAPVLMSISIFLTIKYKFSLKRL